MGISIYESEVETGGKIDTWYHIQYHRFMTIDDAIGELDGHETNTRFQRLITICTTFFGAPRVEGRHHIFKTPWPADPRINLQLGKGKAKPYQVRQVVKALQRLKDVGG
jgi:hypothetical protein